MSIRTQRTLLRTLHLVFGAMMGAVIYLPSEWTDPLRLILGIVVVPAVTITGVWMWQQGRIRKALRRTPPTPAGALARPTASGRAT